MDLDNEVFKKCITDIINKILNSDDFSNEKDVFIWLLKGLKENYKLSILIDNNFLYMSINALDYIDNDNERLEAINAILNCMCNIEYDYNSNFDTILSLFKMSLECIGNGCEIEKDILEIFSSFSDMGIGYDTIFIECVDRFNEEFCINIFSKIKMNWDSYHLEKATHLIDIIEKNNKIKKRFDLILRFYSMVDLFYVDKSSIVNGYLAHPFNYTGLWADWVFFSHQQSTYYDDVITPEEKRIFIEIGDIYEECQTDNLIIHDEDMDKEFDNLWNYLKDAGKKFQLILGTERVRNLMEQFTKGRSFWEIALSLPE